MAEEGSPPPARSAKKLSQSTGWGPLVTFDEGLRRTVEWWRPRPSLGIAA